MKSIVLILTLLCITLPASADRFVNGQAADVVLGQPDFVSNDSGSLSNGFDNPESVAVDPNTGKVFVADSGNYRILRFSSAAAMQSGSGAEAVFGQANFLNTLKNQGGGDNALANTLSFVYQIMVDSQGRLWVADSSNNRVLGYFNASSLGSNPSADVVYGQPSFAVTSSGTTAAKMDSPAGVWVDQNDTLWVGDTDNNRVLRFASVSLKNSGDPADGVLGQTGFLSSGSDVTSTTMYSPNSVSVDSAGRLWVCDTDNNRVLRFDNPVVQADTDGSAADGVLGQQDFLSDGDGLTSRAMYEPYGVLAAADGTLWVGDYSNRRILGFASAAFLSNGAPATYVLGQADFTSIQSGPSARRMTSPINMSQGPNGSLYVADYDDNRVLRFTPVASPTVNFSKRKIKTTKKRYNVKGTTSGEVTQVLYRLKRGGFKTAKGTRNFRFRAKLKSGKNRVSVYAVGPAGESESKSLVIKRKR